MRIPNAGSGLLVADALLLESQARWNDGSAVTAVTLEPMDAIVLHRTSGGLSDLWPAQWPATSY